MQITRKLKPDAPTQKTNRSRAAARSDQCRQRPRKIHPARPPQHAASLVGAATTRRLPRGDLHLAGGRSRRPDRCPPLSKPVGSSQRGERRRRKNDPGSPVRLHRKTGAVGSDHRRGDPHHRARTDHVATDGNPPPLLDPFAGGGSIPLEAQRLGLEAHASDLNPVAVMINKAQIEIPPRFANMPPVNPR